LGATVIGGVNVITANSDGDVKADGGMGRLRIDGSGEVADGKFGGYVRLDTSAPGVGGNAIYSEGYAWWKPIDQLKLIIGQHGDGFFEQNGNSCWGFYQHATDTIATFGGDNSWGGGPGGPSVWPLRMRAAFAHGYDAGGVAIAITPVDMVEINIGLPFFGGSGELVDVFKSAYAQVALNMSFGTIAFTFIGDPTIEQSTIYGFFALKAIDNLQIDFGLGTDFVSSGYKNNPLSIGLAVKYAPGSWGIKFRSLFQIPTMEGQSFGMLFDFLPYFVINDSFRVYISGGIAIGSVDDISAGASWHVNPYIEVGEEWGPKFLAGIKVFQKGDLRGGAPVVFSVPIALLVSF